MSTNRLIKRGFHMLIQILRGYSFMEKTLLPMIKTNLRKILFYPLIMWNKLHKKKDNTSDQITIQDHNQ